MAALPFVVDEHLRAAELTARYHRVRDERGRDPADHYHVVLPRHWETSGEPPARATDDEPFTRHALHGSAGEATLEITTVHLPREVAGADWLELALSSLGHEIVHRVRTPTPGGDAADLLTRSEQDGARYVSRWRTIKDGRADGARLFCLEARAAETRYRELAQDLYVAVHGFELLRPSAWPLAEDLRTYARATPGDFAVLYPRSWSASELHASGDAVALELHNDLGDVELGRISVLCSARGVDGRSLLDVYARSLVTHGVVPELPPLTDAPAFGGVDRAWMTAGVAFLRKGQDGRPRGWAELPADWRRDPGLEREPSQRVTVLVGHKGPTWYLLALVGVRPDVLPSMAMINDRAFSLVATLMHIER